MIFSICLSILIKTVTNIVLNKCLSLPWFGAVRHNISIPWVVEFSACAYEWLYISEALQYIQCSTSNIVISYNIIQDPDTLSRRYTDFWYTPYISFYRLNKPDSTASSVGEFQRRNSSYNMSSEWEKIYINRQAASTASVSDMDTNNGLWMKTAKLT